MRRRFGDLRVNLFLAEENVLNIVCTSIACTMYSFASLEQLLRLRREPRVRGFHAFPQRTMWMVFARMA